MSLKEALEGVGVVLAAIAGVFGITKFLQSPINNRVKTLEDRISATLTKYDCERCPTSAVVSRLEHWMEHISSEISEMRKETGHAEARGVGDNKRD